MNLITSPLGYALKNEERQEPAPKIDLSSPVDLNREFNGFI